MFCAFTSTLPARDGPTPEAIRSGPAGGYMHADDIRTLATSEETLTRRIENLCGREPSQTEHQQVRDCGDRNFAPPSCEVEGSEMPVGDVGKCIGILV